MITQKQMQGWLEQDRLRALDRQKKLNPDFAGTSNFSFGKTSLKRLAGVNPDLVRVFHTAIQITEIDFAVFEGLRTQKRQQWLFDNKKTWTLKSRHRHGFAVDAVPWINGKPQWKLGPILKLAPFVIRAAEIEGVPLRWGGDWDGDGTWQDEQRFDGAHYELPKAQYPDP